MDAKDKRPPGANPPGQGKLKAVDPAPAQSRQDKGKTNVQPPKPGLKGAARIGVVRPQAASGRVLPSDLPVNPPSGGVLLPPNADTALAGKASGGPAKALAEEPSKGVSPVIIILAIVAAVVLGYKYLVKDRTEEMLQEARRTAGPKITLRRDPGYVAPKATDRVPPANAPAPAAAPQPRVSGSDLKASIEAAVRRGEGGQGVNKGFKYQVDGRSSAEVRAEGGMYTKEGGHFNVKFDGVENAVAGHAISLLLEEAYLKVGSDIGFYPDDKVEAVLYTSQQFTDVTRAPSWAGALFDGRIKVPAGGVTEKTDLLEKVLFHEYTHAVVHRISNGRAPTWLHEGMAQYEEGRDESDYKEEMRAVAETKKFSLRFLEGSFMRLSGKSVQAAYMLSLSATRYIIKDYGAAGVRRILENLGAGQGMDEAVQTALHISYDDLEKLWLGSLTR